MSATGPFVQWFSARLETATMLTPQRLINIQRSGLAANLSLHMMRVLLVQSVFSWHCRW